MSGTLHCPFCGSELENACAQVIYFCPNDECHKAKDWYASKQVWRALIDGKKAQDTIQKIKDIVYPALDREFYSELRDDMLYISRIIVSVEKQE